MPTRSLMLMPMVAAIATLWSAAAFAQTLEWVANDLRKLGDELQELEAELQITEKRARESSVSHEKAKAAWQVCVAHGRTTDKMNEDVDKLESAREDAEAHRRETETHRTNLERFHGRLKLDRVEVEVAKGLDYDRQLLERYINPMRSTYFPSVKSVLASYDSYTATIGAYQGVFTDAGDRCQNTKTIAQWLSQGVQTVVGVAAQLSTTAATLKEVAELRRSD